MSKSGSLVILTWLMSAAAMAAELPAQASPEPVSADECAVSSVDLSGADPQERRLLELRAERSHVRCQLRKTQEKLQRLTAEQRRRSCPPRDASPSHESEASKQALTKAYVQAIQEAVETRWVRPATLPIGARCKMFIRQLPGGEVIAVRADPGCPYDEPSRLSAEAAVLRAQPLPYCGYESVFSEMLILNFEARDL